MSKRSEALETRRKIAMVLAASGKRLTSVQLVESPLLSGMSTKAIGAHLRQLVREKQVRRNKDGSWSSLKGYTSGPTETKEGEKPKMFFVLNTTTKTLELNVGGVRLPVEIET